MALNSEYRCINGQSYSDVILNTYGTMDLYVKGLSDNNGEPNALPVSGQIFKWDNTLVNNETTTVLINKKSVKYATLIGFGIPVQPNPNMSTYKDPLSTSYTASADGETTITIAALQGCEVVQVTKEIHPLTTSQYTFNQTAGTITLVGGLSLVKDETLFVIYKKTVQV